MKTLASFVAPLAGLAAASLIAGAASAQAVTAAAPVPNPPPATTPPTTVADPGYTGALQGPAFRDVDARIAAVTPKAHGKKAMSMLNSIKGEERMRKARHGGELRDWDRELLNKKLDQLEGMVGG